MKINREYIKRNIARIPHFFQQCRHFGFHVAFWTLAYPFCLLFGRFKFHFIVNKHKAILKYLYKHYGTIINNFTNRYFEEGAVIEAESNIWVCWWDGHNSMPPLVKACYNSIRQHSGTHAVQLITKYNFREFISMPEYILNKVDKGIITVTHFSDILRSALLYEYGGIWIDATILTLRDISFESLPFYTLKTTTGTNSIGHIRWQGLSNSSASFHNHIVPEINRWSGFLLAGTKHSPLFEFMRDLFYAFWKEHNDIIEYLFIDYVLDIACDIIPAVKNMIDKVPCIDTDKFSFEKNMNTEFSEEKFAKYALTPFHKLTWKMKFDVYTKDNKLTMYGHILNTFLN